MFFFSILEKHEFLDLNLKIISKLTLKENKDQLTGTLWHRGKTNKQNRSKFARDQVYYNIYFNRLERLFVLLETGQSTFLRKSAAFQIGQVVKTHPNELGHLLEKVNFVVSYKKARIENLFSKIQS